MRYPVTVALVVATLMAPIATGASARPLILAVGGEPDTGFDPITGWGAYGNPLFQSTLLKRDADLELQGDLATDWSLSDDRTTWTVTLREDAQFSDGTPLTAADVVFTFNTARDAGGLVDLAEFDEARATGEYEVELVLSEPQITFVNQLATLGIVPEETYGDDYARNPVGSGPFQMVEWREGEQLVVEPNPNWYGGDIPFERVTFVFGSEDMALSLAQTGEAELVAVPPARAESAPEGMTVLHVESVDNRGLMFPMVPDEGRTTDTGAPIGNDVTSDRAIRVAVNQALDREALVTLALNGQGRPATGPANGLPWGNPDGAIQGNDQEGARTTLDEAGWNDSDGDGTRDRDGQAAAFTIVYPSSDSTRQALALGAAQQLSEVGLDVTPAGHSWDEIRALAHANVVTFGWGAHDPSEIYHLHHGDYAGIGYFNPGFYDNETVNAHLDAAESAESFEASLSEWQAAEWDGETGFGSKGDAAWAWMVNLEHSYWVDACLDTGAQQIQPHGHGFPITYNLPDWRWTCEE